MATSAFIFCLADERPGVCRSRLSSPLLTTSIGPGPSTAIARAVAVAVAILAGSFSFDLSTTCCQYSSQLSNLCIGHGCIASVTASSSIRTVSARTFPGRAVSSLLGVPVDLSYSRTLGRAVSRASRRRWPAWTFATPVIRVLSGLCIPSLTPNLFLIALQELQVVVGRLS